MNYQSYDFSIGSLYITESHRGIAEIYPTTGNKKPQGTEKATPLLNTAAQQLEDYLQGIRTCFDLPLAPKGTDFQQKVWQELLKIPYGTTRSYGEIAADMGKPKAAQAVGQAIGHNPIMIIIPCHRVIGKDNSLTGYAWGLPLKKQLLTLEKRSIDSDKSKAKAL